MLHRCNIMFYGASSFNRDLNGWDVSSVTDMFFTFSGASSFNGNISDWDVSNVRSMSYMFALADSFNRDISSWDIGNVIAMKEMFIGTRISTKIYDRMLAKWSNLPSLQTGVEFNAGNSNYYCTGKNVKEEIFIKEKGWTILDNGIKTDSANFLNFDYKVKDVLCKNGKDGSIEIINIGGLEGWYTFMLDGNESNLTGLPGKVGYKLKINDNNGCRSAEKVVNITEPDSVSFNIDVVEDVTCKGREDGSISVKDITGGSGGYKMKIKIPSSLSGVIGGSWKDVLDFSGYTIQERDYLKLEEVSFGTSGNPAIGQTDEIIYNNNSRVKGILEVPGSTVVIGGIQSAYWVYISGFGSIYPVKVKLKFRVTGDRLEASLTEGGYKESIYPIEQEDVNDAYFKNGWSSQTFQ